MVDFSEQQIQKFLMVSLFLAYRNVFHEGGQVLESMAEITYVFIRIEYILAAYVLFCLQVVDEKSFVIFPDTTVRCN